MKVLPCGSNTRGHYRRRLPRVNRRDGTLLRAVVGVHNEAIALHPLVLAGRFGQGGGDAGELSDAELALGGHELEGQEVKR